MVRKETIHYSFFCRGDTRCTILSPHLERLGAVLLLLEKYDLLGLPIADTIRTRHRKKVAVDGYGAIRLLMVLSVTAWLEMVERWHSMPESSSRHLQMVCNLNSLELRCMGKLVQEEHTYSSTPLVDRCCAMCGKMLASSTQFKRNQMWNGKRGAACQIRGSTVAWDSMPPFLLLWSKQKLGVFLRAVCNYDSVP